MKSVPFIGAGTALITPFTESGAVDFPALDRLIDRQLQAGISALIMLGTTGEPSTLTIDEQDEILRRARRRVNNSAALVAGVGGNNTAHCVERCKRVRDLGADAALAVTPYYNKTSPSGLEAHFTAIADAADLPVIVYNVPGRTGLNLTPDTMDTLADNPVIVGLKEASSNIEQIVDLFARVHDRVAIYSGSDDQNLVYLALGGEGVISVLSNLAPAAVSRLCRECLSGDLAAARGTARTLHPLAKALFWETSPIPLKAAMSHAGLCGDTVRLPLVKMRADLRERLLALMDGGGAGMV
ncbi:MAG: 4-hydroxy-tetrahydrodipicolinate synthase [Oscillospiraceae bacterium]|jgi:4-hydroxy-tetrahydrodipicolinate synthase|nr:4-hydroxy-tetrahydrodipicolinate synthase [Oscillospiraceae bacterium]